MKAKINYKSRKTIIIIAIAVILVIAAIAGTVAFIKGNNNAAAAMPEDEQTTIGDAQNNNGGDANQNGGNPSENPSDNPQTELPAVDANNNGTTTAGNDGTVTGNNGTTGTTNGGTTTNGNGTGTTAGTTTGTAGTGATVPNQDYTQTTTVITENPWETKTIGWSPLSISAYTAAANLGINKPELSTEKLAYVQGDSLTEAPVHTAIQKGEVITYVIKLTVSLLKPVLSQGYSIYQKKPSNYLWSPYLKNSLYVSKIRIVVSRLEYAQVEKRIYIH